VGIFSSNITTAAARAYLASGVRLRAVVAVGRRRPTMTASRG
jgi:hypothetical protein